jgi:CarD family transcriptional regulator
MDFEVGDHVVHPAHGAGEIVQIEEEELATGFSRYYVVSFPDKRLTVRIPLSRSEELGLREVIGSKRVTEVMQMLNDSPESLPSDFKARRQLLEKWINTGRPVKLAQAVRDLAWRRTEKRLNKADTELFERAHQRLLQEMSLALGQGIQETEARIMSALAAGRDALGKEAPEAAAAD